MLPRLILDATETLLTIKKQKDHFGLLCIINHFSIKLIVIIFSFYLETLAYQPTLAHGLIRSNIKIRFIDKNYNYLSHPLFRLLNILMHTLKYIFILLLLIGVSRILGGQSKK